jgi:hypothetical protein
MGQTGATGPAGPQLSTQMGVWSSSATTTISEGDHSDGSDGGTTRIIGFAAISFSAPLSQGLDSAHVHFVKLNELVAGCAAGTVAEPKAEAGHLCVYLGKVPTGLTGSVTAASILNAATGTEGSAKSGARVMLEGSAFAMNGTWAMTVP